MKTQLDRVAKIFECFDDYDIIITNTRCTLPAAYFGYNSRQDKKPIEIEANKPSLIRYALIDLIMHEIAHAKFYEKYPDFEGEEHDNPEFIKIENELRREVEKKIAEEHI